MDKPFQEEEKKCFHSTAGTVEILALANVL